MKLDKVKLQLEMARQCKGTRDLVAVGFSPATVRRATQGGELGIKTVGRIARALGVDAEELIEQKED